MSSRPDFAVLVYPGIANWSRGIAPGTPPTFIFVNSDDNLSTAAAEYYLALKKAGMTAELHVFRRGGHGVGIAGRSPEFAQMPQSRWPELLHDWMGDLGYLK